MNSETEIKNYNYTAQERLSIRGAGNYLFFIFLIGSSSVLLQIISRLSPKNIITTSIFAIVVTSFAYYIYKQRKERKDPNLVCWLVGLISIFAPIVTKYNYAKTMDWTYAAQSYHATAMIFTLLIMLQFLQKKKIFIVCSLIVFGNWIVFLILAAKNGALFHLNAYPNGKLIHDGVLLTREVSFMILGFILTYAAYRTISVIFKYDNETVSQHKIIENQKNKLKEYANKLEEKVTLRTKELTDAVDELQTTNDQLIQAKDSLWGEMQLAHKIQTILLPQKPIIEGFEISAFMKTADEVGGDYYDIINTNDKDWIIIGDVSGHGVPAGLIMMMAQSCIRSHVEEKPDIKPSNLLEIVNKTISHNIELMNEKKFMTITAIAMDKSGSSLFSGKHEDLLIYRSKDKTVENIKTDGICISPLPLGKKDINNKFKLEPGDILMAYTDGIIEAVHKDCAQSSGHIDGEMFTLERLTDILMKNGHKNVVEIKNIVIETIKDYEADDDITIVIIKKL